MPGLRDVEEEIYTHEHLWRSSTVLLEKSKAEEQPSYHLLLPALLMAFLAFEAFINFCGFVRRPDLWKDEKKHLKGKGLEGKIEVIVETLPDFKWCKGQRPYQTIRTLEDFRGAVAHGKVIASHYIAEERDGGGHFSFTHVWDNYISGSAVEAARADIKNFSQSLLLELRKVSVHPHLDFDAFEGSLASGNSSSVRQDK